MPQLSPREAAARRQSPSREAAPGSSVEDTPVNRSSRRRTVLLAFGSSLAVWLSFPPVDMWPLAWIAPLGWLLLVRQAAFDVRRPYRLLWLAGFAFWIATLQWLRYPHWSTAIGWVALSAYFACYLPLFVGLARVGVHRLRVPLWLAAPIVWTALELVRGHLFTGLTVASLGHTQYRWLAVIQSADLVGAYGVGFVVVCVAASIARAVPWNGERLAPLHLAPGAVLLAAVMAYGHARLSGEYTRPGPRVALIQGSIDTTIKTDPAMKETVFREYFGLSRDAVREHDAVDLVVWPETMFREPWLTYQPDAAPADDQEWTRPDLEEASRQSRVNLADTARALDVPLLLGIDRIDYGNRRVEHFNTAVLVDRAGDVLDHYDKMHPVMFGEYIPFGDWFPVVYRLTPLSSGLAEGAAPVAMEVAGARLAPSICFENFLPHLIRRQVLELAHNDREPDVLVNLTNDGWFYGSSELDLHLVNGIFRAVECRKPMLIAANTGFSAWIDADGRLIERGPRRATAVIVADVALDSRRSWYLAYGDLAAGACLAVTLGFAVAGPLGRRRKAA